MSRLGRRKNKLLNDEETEDQENCHACINMEDLLSTASLEFKFNGYKVHS